VNVGGLFLVVQFQNNGQIRYQGSVEELREDEEVRKKYLLV
jgi:ABC-type branched-subunit amino acid transport system ATPase component